MVDIHVEEVMPMPLAGLMSLESLEVAAKLVDGVDDELVKAGCRSKWFEMTFSVFGLVCVQQLHISNRGLVKIIDGVPFKIVDLNVS